MCAQAVPVRVVVFRVDTVHNEFTIRQRLACDQVAGGEQAQFGRQMCVGLHKHEPLGAALDDAVRDDPAVTHGPDDFANR